MDDVELARVLGGTPAARTADHSSASRSTPSWPRSLPPTSGRSCARIASFVPVSCTSSTTCLACSADAPAVC